MTTVIYLQYAFAESDTQWDSMLRSESNGFWIESH